MSLFRSPSARQLVDAFRTYFPADEVVETKPSTASEDVGSFGTG